MTHTAIPEDELRVFQSLEDIRVVFDVGARDDVDYLIIKPDIELHAFEPNLVFFEELKKNIGDSSKVYLNNYALGDVEGLYEYIQGLQSIGEQTNTGVQVRRLDEYVKEHEISSIDFLKIDTEGYELKVLIGAVNTIPLCRYIQYETGRNDFAIQELLRTHGFLLEYIGGRNMICFREGEKRPWIPEEPNEGGLTEKSDKNYL